MGKQSRQEKYNTRKEWDKKRKEESTKYGDSKMVQKTSFYNNVIVSKN